MSKIAPYLQPLKIINHTQLVGYFNVLRTDTHCHSTGLLNVCIVHEVAAKVDA